MLKLHLIVDHYFGSLVLAVFLLHFLPLIAEWLLYGRLLKRVPYTNSSPSALYYSGNELAGQGETWL